jgi:hypothetical protein
MRRSLLVCIISRNPRAGQFRYWRDLPLTATSRKHRRRGLDRRRQPVGASGSPIARWRARGLASGTARQQQRCRRDRVGIGLLAVAGRPRPETKLLLYLESMMIRISWRRSLIAHQRNLPVIALKSAPQARKRRSRIPAHWRTRTRLSTHSPPSMASGARDTAELVASARCT